VRKIVQVTEVEGEGLTGLLGKNVTLFCMNYIYTGLLEGINSSCILLTNAKIVYETGPLTTKDWKDAQPLPDKWYVQLSAVESFGDLK
jgi:hypothetical protein